jgi:hypothetical protein
LPSRSQRGRCNPGSDAPLALRHLSRGRRPCDPGMLRASWLGPELWKTSSGLSLTVSVTRLLGSLTGEPARPPVLSSERLLRASRIACVFGGPPGPALDPWKASWCAARLASKAGRRSGVQCHGIGRHTLGLRGVSCLEGQWLPGRLAIRASQLSFLLLR